MTAAIYLRVSTTKKTRGEYDQNPRVQAAPLLEMAAARGWQTVTYQDRASGADENRPAWKKLLADARRGKFSIVAVWSFDRAARSVRQLVNALEEFRALKVDFISHQQAIDTSTPSGRMHFHLVAAFAELEREMIRDRVTAGLEHARHHGTKSGRAIGRPKAILRRDLVLQNIAKGQAVNRIAQEMQVSRGTVYNIIREAAIAQTSKNQEASNAQEIPPPQKPTRRPPVRTPRSIGRPIHV